MEHHHVGKLAGRGFEHAGRRIPGVDLAIAFVREHQEPEFLGKGEERPQIFEIGDRTLGVGRGGEVEGDGAGQQRLGQRSKIRQKAGLRRRGEKDRLAIGRQGARRIGGIERVRDQDRRVPARLDPALGRDGGQKQPLAGAAEHHDLPFRIDRTVEPVAARKPFRGGAAEALGALAGRIAAEIREMRGDHRADEGRNRVLRLADRQIDRVLARLDLGQQLGQPHERRTAVRGPARRRASIGFGFDHGHAQNTIPAAPMTIGAAS